MNLLDHDVLRQLADTWGLLLLVAVFCIAVFMAFRPGARAYYRECAQIPLKDNPNQPERERAE